MSSTPAGVLTQSYLKDIIEYNEYTGIVTWKVSQGSAKAGSIVGKSTNSSGYSTIKILGKTYQLHRIIYLLMTGKMPVDDIDHKNHNRKDNKWSNLRAVTRQQNSMNRKKIATNSSGRVGVYSKNGKWQASICVKGKQKYLGIFDNFDDAANAREEAELKYSFHSNHGK